ncbi:hypothetical protein [Terriglobus saanensis]|uniref:Uncharacterized protein n=1 Tax=Terriglobus saanensis (strain ATCC BAA-1853 / DSM 23119 / SP1PR4) TaxID=401053 RepID=E8V380_TERSS|nr:hypothetical protein [Terriglobus saanensis]ADV82437.1 hypothetical protein AciPR4_1623 [Terriglobus saanensis SP1PR4]
MILLAKAVLIGASPFALMFFTFSCGEKAFNGGIRDVTTVALEANPLDETYLGGVNDRGSLNYVNPTGGSAGSASTFSGTTETADGISDHPDAITNSSWYIQMDWSQAEPACTDPNLQAQLDAQVGGSGAIFRWHCLL